MVAGGSVTVLAHPSLTGINSGSGISGSTVLRFIFYRGKIVARVPWRKAPLANSGKHSVTLSINSTQRRLEIGGKQGIGLS